jgi:hypothetical protein
MNRTQYSFDPPMDLTVDSDGEGDGEDGLSALPDRGGRRIFTMGIQSYKNLKYQEGVL